MVQTVGATGFVGANVNIGTNSSVSTELDGVGVAIAVTGGDRDVSEGFTFDGDTPIISAGKRAALTIEVRFLYTEETAEGFKVAQDIYETEGAACFISYSPKGGGSGDYVFSSAKSGVKAAGIMNSFTYPSGEAGDATLVPASFTITVAELLQDSVA